MENNIEKRLKEMEHDLEEMEKHLGSYHKANMVALDVIENVPLKRGLRTTFSEIERCFDSKITSLKTNINKIRKLK